MSLVTLTKRIQNKEARIAVIGLGYVGLPVACRFAQVGFEVIGVDILANRVAAINAGVSPIKGNEPGLGELIADVTASGRLRATTAYAELAECEVILIDVETPVDDQHQPRYDALRSCLKSLGPVLAQGALVIVESTISPGTIQNLVAPILEESSGRKLGKDFYLGNCPERVMPGKLLENLRTLSRVVGGMTPETAEAMIALYGHIVEADLDPTDCITAELVKTVENAYRDVQIAFANEVAMLSEAVGGDVWKVRELVNKSPGRHMLFPGAGVGGHCIPKDPWLLVHAVEGRDFRPLLIPTARNINDQMPLHVLRLLEETLSKNNKALKDAQILVLGYTYLEDSDDTRNTPSVVLIDALLAAGANVVVHDPYVEAYVGDALAMAKGSDAAVLMVKHSHYATLNLQELKQVLNTPVLIDGRGFLSPTAARSAGLDYVRLGTG
ncbi:MAG: nucleotide sugar dehydrogenase [Anaerolineales bacterium]|nr:nucleotide sugar dehydrogenase [Anaerolineales bacterium]